MPTQTLPRLLLSLTLLFNLAARPLETASVQVASHQAIQRVGDSTTQPISNLLTPTHLTPDTQPPITDHQSPISNPQYLISNTYLITSLSDSGPSTLRQALLDANANPGPDTIEFAIGTTGSQQTIALITALPTISDPVFLDGWSQGGSGYAGPPLIEINGSAIPTWNTSNGLLLTAGDSTVRGFAINYFNIALNLTTAGNNVITGNYIGLALDGDMPIGNRTGISISATSDNNRIGTDGDGVNDEAERNVIAASGYVQVNNSMGILIASGSDGHWIAGNYIGTDATGTQDRGNVNSGINTGGLVIIGTNGDGVGDDVEGNLISGNNGDGILLSTTSSGSRVAGNRIGTDVTGTTALPNNSDGVGVGSCSTGQCSDYVIGTNGDGISDALEGNLISGNGSDGVFILAGTLDNNVIAGNLIGTNISGTASIPNGDYGVHLGGDFSRLGTNNDGVSDALEGNLISGNGNGAGNNNHGVYIPSGADHHLVAGNRIGTNAAGDAALPNGQTGVYVGDDFNTITGNLISGNGEHGVQLNNAFFNTVTDNLIGTAADGATPLGNTLNGVFITNNSDDNVFGGANPGTGNIIAFNGGNGIFVNGGTSCGGGFCLRNHITGNSLFANAGRGIDLYPSGVTPNDPLDLDTGANTLQNYPILTAATSSGTTLVLTGTLNSTANLTFTLDVYSSPACDSLGAGEGAVYLGAGQVTTDGNGDAAFTFTLPGLAQSGDSITATATDPDGNTSEFSACVTNLGEEPITGLQATNDSPTFLGLPTHFTATLTTGTGVTYAWDFGDGATGIGATPAHMYTATGAYTATVTATNSLGSAEAATLVTILPPPACAATPDEGATLFTSADASAVQQAVDTPQAAGGIVKIAGTCAGVSTRNGLTQTVYIEDMLTLSGGYSLGNWTTPDPDSPSVLDALGLGRVIYVDIGAPLTLENLIVQNGHAVGEGGGLYTWGSLTLMNVTFQNNSADGGGGCVATTLQALDSNWLNNTGTTQRGGGLYVVGDAAITGGMVQGNAATYAGGIYADAELVISGTQFISNTSTSPVAGSGGAIYSSGPLDITNALFQGNQAQTGAGAVLHSPGANEFLSISNTQFINNSTLNNVAQGGALYTNAESSTIHFSTFQGNSAPGSLGAGGAIVAFKAITLTETTLISNTVGGQGGAIYHWGLSEPGQTYQITPLILVDSVLIGNNAGAEGGGLYFRQGFDAENVPVHLMNTTFDHNTAALAGGGTYLGQPAVIVDSLFLGNQSTGAEGGALYASASLTLTQTVFQGNLATRAGGAYVVGDLAAIDSHWLDNIGTTERGGGLEVYGEAAITGGLVQGNAAKYGGGVFADAGLVISGTQFINNTATSPSSGSGGALYAMGPLEIINALFEGNQAQTGAGAVLHSPGAGEFLTITNTQFINNTTLHTFAQGGALYAGASASTIQSSTFQGNTAPGSSGAGGAIVAFKALTLTETSLISNTVGGQGGAIYHWGLSETGQTEQINPLTVMDSTLSGNLAGNQGGGLYFRQGFTAENIPIHITRTTFENNIATQEGGGAYLSQPARVEDSTFQGNASLNAAGGGVALLSDGTVLSQVSNTVFFDNRASLGGASVYVNSPAPLDILHTTLAGTGAASEQGITVVATDVQITNTIIVSHTVGIVASGGAVVTADHTLFHANQMDAQDIINLNPVYGDPQFLDLPRGDFHLTLGSPAIDAGATTSITTDFEADLRPIISQSDLGADEFGDSAVGDPGSTTTVGGGGITITIPPGALGGPGNILFIPTFPPTFIPPTPWLPISPGFQLIIPPFGHAPTDIGPTFLLPITITLTYADSALSGIDESTLSLAVYDASNGEWVDATSTCAEPGVLIHNPDENQITVTTCASGEFAVIGAAEAGMFEIFLPVIKR